MVDEASGLPGLDEETGFPKPESWLSILQFFVKEEHAEEFEQLCDDMYELAKTQPGFKWAHYGRSSIDGRYFIISEWDSLKAMKDWENVEEHGLAMDKGDPMYHPGRLMENRKFIPWQKPGTPKKAWTG
jgi:heme-degrading monooxygenase HmoA